MKKEVLYSYAVITLFILVSLSFIHFTSKEHKRQLEFLKEVNIEKARAHFNNLSTLISLETKLSNHTKPNHSNSMIAFKLIEYRNKDFASHFKMTSLNPLNKKNSPDSFEKRGLLKFEQDKGLKDYAEFNEKELHYIGKLSVEKSCLICHGVQGYKIGDIRGGLRITLPLDEYNKEVISIKEENKTELIYIFVYSLLTLIFFLLFFIYNKRTKTKIEDINHSLEDKVKDRTLQLQNNHNQVITSFIKLIEQRDPYTAGHSERVAKYSVEIAKQMNLNHKTIEIIRQAAILHDIGKIAIPDNLLLKPDKLTVSEFKLIQDHTNLGFAILNSIDEYQSISKIVKHHHERFDGSGYPDGLTADEIPIESQIISLADTFDAITSNRIYKPRKTIRKAISEVKALSGKSFNPSLIKYGLKAIRNVEVEFTTQLPSSTTEELRFAYFFKDPLTKLYNEKYLLSKITQEWEKYKNYTFTLLIVKNFTMYNEQYSWRKGNKFLIQIANILEDNFPNCIIARYEGDDFVILHREIECQKEKIIDLLPKTEIITYEIYSYKINEHIKTIKQMLDE